MGDRTARPPYAYREPAREGQRHGADRARLVAARRLGAAELVRARVVRRRAGDARPASTRSPSGCATCPIRAPPTWCARPRRRPAGACAPARRKTRRRPSFAAAEARVGPGGDILFGQGFAYARYVHSKWPGFGAAWSAWVADVEVNRQTGEVHVRRVVVGHDAGLMINPAGVEHQIHGNVIQTTSRALKERVRAPTPRARSVPVASARMGQLPDPRVPRRAGDRGAARCSARASRRSARASRPRCRAPRRSPTRSSTPPACASARRRSRRRWCARR